MNQDCFDVIRIMEQSYAKDIRVFDESFLLKSIDKRVAANSISHRTDYPRLLANSNAEAQNLWDSLSVTYSLFFRNPLTFTFLAHSIFPAIIKRKSPNEEVRIWSAGCASGQETYSIAILLDQILSTEEKAPSVRIFATDRNTAAIEAAREGQYDASEVQNVSHKQFERYLVRDGESFRISPRLKDKVEFSVHDLLDDQSVSPPASIYGDFDLVMCSNLLFYYTHDVRHAILNKIYLSLAPDGFFVTGEVERAIVEIANGFREITPPTAVYQKISR